MANRGSWTGSGVTAPAGTTNWTPEYGGKPVVPDPLATGAETLSWISANLPQYQKLATNVNAFNVGEMNTALGGLIPDYQNLREKQSGVIGSYLAGELPQDVINTIAQGAAERGVTTGTAGSPNATAAYLRSLGLSSLDLQKMGISGLQTAISETPTPQLFNFSQMFPQASDVQQARMAANLYASAPDPMAAAKEAISLAGAPAMARPKGETWATINPSGGGGIGTTKDWNADLPWNRNNIVMGNSVIDPSILGQQYLSPESDMQETNEYDLYDQWFEQYGNPALYGS